MNLLSSDQFVLWIIIMHLMLAVGYVIYGFIKGKDRKKYVIVAIIIAITPPIGCVIFIVAQLLYNILFAKDIDRDAVSFSKKRVKIYTLPDEERELNVVPVNETLAVSDKGTQRQLILNVLKDYYDHSLATISEALHSRDSEVSHYAASALMDAISDFRSTAQNMLHAMQKHQDDMEVKMICFCYLRDALRKRFLPGLEYKSYIYTLNDVLKEMVDFDQDLVVPQCYEDMADFLLELKDYTNAYLWCEQLKMQYPFTLSYYKSAMKLAYAEGNTSLFFSLIKQLEGSDINIDSITLDLIRTLKHS